MESFNRKANKPLYFMDLALTKSVDFLFNAFTKALPKRLSKKAVNLQGHKKALNNIAGLTLFNALGGLLVLVTNVKLANTMGAALYGTYSYCLAIGEVGSNIVRYGKHKTMLRELVQHPDKRDSLISHTFILGLVNLCVFMAVVSTFHGLLDIKLNLAYLLLIIAPCLMSLDFLPVYESMKMMGWHSIYYLIQKALFLITIWGVILLALPVSLPAVAIALFASWLIILVMQYWEITKQLVVRIFHSFQWQLLWKQYKDNFIIAMSCLLGVAFGPLIRLILKMYVDTTAVGIYSAGLQLFLVGQFIMHQIGRVGNPMMAELGKTGTTAKKMTRDIKRYAIAMVASALPFIIPFCLFPVQITRWFFTSEYSGMSMMLPWLGLYLFALAVGIVATQFLISMRKDKVYFAIYIGGALLTVIASVTLIPLWGLLGATISLCLPQGVACVFYVLFSLRYIKAARVFQH